MSSVAIVSMDTQTGFQICQGEEIDYQGRQLCRFHFYLLSQSGKILFMSPKSVFPKPYCTQNSQNFIV